MFYKWHLQRGSSASYILHCTICCAVCYKTFNVLFFPLKISWDRCCAFKNALTDLLALTRRYHTCLAHTWTVNHACMFETKAKGIMCLQGAKNGRWSPRVPFVDRVYVIRKVQNRPHFVMMAYIFVKYSIWHLNVLIRPFNQCRSDSLCSFHITIAVSALLTTLYPIIVTETVSSSLSHLTKFIKIAANDSVRTGLNRIRLAVTECRYNKNVLSG